MSDLDDSNIQKIHKSAVENTMAEYSSVVKGVNINTLQAESKKALNKYDFSCANCGSQGILDGDEELLLTLERPASAFESKDEAVDSSNLVPLCRECFDEAEGEAVSSAEQSKTTSERLQYTIRNFERLSAIYTPSMIIRQSMSYILIGFVLSIVGLLGYGIYSPLTIGDTFSLAVNLIVGFGTALIIDYTLITFIGVIPIIAMYTLFEHYQPDEYAKEQYTTSWKLGQFSIPYIVHPLLLLLLSIYIPSVWLMATTDIGFAIAENSVYVELAIVGLVVSWFLIATFPRVFRRIVRADRSKIMAQSQLSKVSEEIVLDKYDDIIITSNQTTKPHLTESYIREFYDEYEQKYDSLPDLTGEYYSPILWIFGANLMVTYILLTYLYVIILGITLHPIIELLLLSSPSILLIVYIVYRKREMKASAEEIKNLEDKIESETSIGGKK